MVRAADLDAWLIRAGFAQGWRDPLAIGLAASLVLHALLLSLRFGMPAPIRFAPIDAQLEVVLLNAGTPTRPVKADVAAQVSMEGGGDRDRGRARSPLPADTRMQDGTTLRDEARRVAELEARQRELVALAHGPRSYVDSDPAQAQRAPDPATESLEDTIRRLQAQIDKRLEDYSKRPKRLTYGINAVGVSYARYVDEWAARIERIGTERYPPEARGRLYDSLVITVEIDKHGNVVDVVINKPSRHEVLNQAVRRIVHAGAPYPRFTPEMARDGDILQIVRTWSFTNDALSTEALRRP